jgi:hypothetical protein
MTNDEATQPFSDFGVRHSFDIRHSCFVIRSFITKGDDGIDSDSAARGKQTGQQSSE